MSKFLLAENPERLGDGIVPIWSGRTRKSMNMNKSEKILEYFRSHPFVSPSLVAKHVGYDPGSLSKLINKTGRLVSIPEKYIAHFEEALKEPTERCYSREDVLDLLCDYADLIHSTKSRTPLQHEWLANWEKVKSLSPKEGNG